MQNKARLFFCWAQNTAHTFYHLCQLPSLHDLPWGRCTRVIDYPSGHPCFLLIDLNGGYQAIAGKKNSLTLIQCYTDGVSFIFLNLTKIPQSSFLTAWVSKSRSILKTNRWEMMLKSTKQSGHAGLTIYKGKLKLNKFCKFGNEETKCRVWEIHP